MKGSLVFEIARSTPWILIGGSQRFPKKFLYDKHGKSTGIFTMSQWILL